MGPFVEATELSKALIEAGNKLLKPYSSTDALLTLLDEIESLLAAVEQDPAVSVYNALFPSMKALVSAEFLRNTDSDVRVSAVACLTEIVRITAPDAPYNDDQMKEIFQVTVEAFGKLSDASCRSYKKAKGILETVSKVRSSLVMLDLEFDDLILEMFRLFLKIASPDHSQLVLLSMETIMVTVIDESEEVSMDLLKILLTTLKKDRQDVSPMALKLAEEVLSSCFLKLQQRIMEVLKSTGTSLDMYTPVVSSICQSESATTQDHNVVNAKENENKLDLGLSRKKKRSKRTAKGETDRANGGQLESIDAETESASTRKRGRKPNSLMNPEEGYSFKTSSSKKQLSLVISLSPSSKARKVSRKRSRSKMEETNHDAGSIATPTAKKQNLKQDDPEKDDLMESNLETPEDGVTAKSSKKEKAKNDTTSAKKPLTEKKSVKTSGKKSVGSEAKKKNSEAASKETPTTESSKSKKKNSRATMPLTKECDQTPKSLLKRKRTAKEEVESEKNELGDKLIGKRVNIWWPLDKEFYEGVIDSYCSRKKMHRVTYPDGVAEELNLMNERWVIIQDNSSACKDKEIDLPDSIPLSDLIRRKGKKSKNFVRNSTKQVKRTKGAVKVVSNEPESRDGENLKSLNEMNSEPGGTKGKTEKRQKVTRDMDRESEKDSNEKVEAESKGEDSLKDGKGSSKTDHKKLSEDPNAETKTDALELNSVKESDVEPKTDGEEREAAEEPIEEAKTDGEEHKSAKETNAEPETDEQEQEQKSLKEPNAESKSDGKEQNSGKEPNAGSETAIQERETAKEPIADTKLVEKEGISEEKRQASDRETYTSADKAEVGTSAGSG